MLTNFECVSDCKEPENEIAGSFCPTGQQQTHNFDPPHTLIELERLVHIREVTRTPASVAFGVPL